MRILPLFIPHQGCPFACIYCNQYSITKSKDESKEHFKSLIADFCAKNETIDKEIAFFGGTFTALSREQQEEYFSLIQPYRQLIRGIRISTRPDTINPDILNYLKSWGVTTIELGIQSFDDAVLKASHRGYVVASAIESCSMVIEAGFDLVIQLMPGLPEDTIKSYSATLDVAIGLQPQGIRLYPTVVLKGTILADWFTAGKYHPLSLAEAVNWLKISHSKCNKANIRIIKTGLHSDINLPDIVAGPYHPTLGELVQIELLFDELVSKWQPDKTLLIPARRISLFLGHNRLLIKKLKEKLLLDKIAVSVNKEKNEREFSFNEDKAEYNW